MPLVSADVRWGGMRDEPKERLRRRLISRLQAVITMNARLGSIEEKLNMLLGVLPELENYKIKISQLEEENKSLQASLQNAQEEIDDLKMLTSSVESQQRNINTTRERVEKDINELRRRHVKLECHSCRGNLKFFGVKERLNESNNDTETVLREFLKASSGNK